MKNWVLANREDFGDRHYTMKADPGLNYFFNLRPSVLNRLRDTFGTDFCVFIAGDEDTEDDFWAIPFARVADLFTEETLTKDGSKNPGRWLCNITRGQLHVFPGAEGGQRGSALVTDVSDCYGVRRGLNRMKVKIIMDRNAPSSHKSFTAQKIHHDLGSKVNISGDVITVDEGYDERKVIGILNGERINYSRST